MLARTSIRAARVRALLLSLKRPCSESSRPRRSVRIRATTCSSRSDRTETTCLGNVPDSDMTRSKLLNSCGRSARSWSDKNPAGTDPFTIASTMFSSSLENHTPTVSAETGEPRSWTISISKPSPTRPTACTANPVVEYRSSAATVWPLRSAVVSILPLTAATITPL